MTKLQAGIRQADAGETISLEELKTEVRNLRISGKMSPVLEYQVILTQ
jgi:hypothetical protein